MGYDTKIHVGTKSTLLEPVLLEWVSMDLGKLGDSRLYNLKSKYKDTPCAIFASDGDTHITEDCYGDKLIAIPLKEFLKVLKQDNEDYYKGNHPRVDWAQILLNRLSKEREDLVVVMYGH